MFANDLGDLGSILGHITPKTLKIVLVGFRSLVEEESTYWALVNSLNLQNEPMDVYQSDISKMLWFSTSNLVSFMFIKSRHFTEVYLILLHKTSHTPLASFSSSFRVPVAERAHLLFLRGKIVRGITTTIVFDTSLLNTQQYKVCLKGQVQQSRERSSALPYTSV